MDTSNDICRFCFQTTESMEDIFDSKMDYIKEINALTGIKISEEIKYPSLICKDCQEVVKILINFKDKCKKSELVLRQIEIDSQNNSNEINTQQWDASLNKRNDIVPNSYELQSSAEEKRWNRKRKLRSCKVENLAENLPESESIIVEPDTESSVIEKEESVVETPENCQGSEKPLVKQKRQPKSCKQKITKVKGEKYLTEKQRKKSNDENSPEPKSKKYKSIKSVTTCHICGKQYETCRLKYHLNIHTGERPFPCTFENCDKKFHSPFQLRNHNKMCHTDHFPYKCDICGRQFKARATYKFHRSYHFDPEIPCTMCNKLLRNKRTLKKHMLVHTGERPFTCNVCSKSFQNRYTLNVHQRVHTKEKPFICESCGQSFAYNCLLKAHINKHHVIQEIKL